MPHEQVEIRHAFDLMLKAEKASLHDMLLLCNAFDGYEVVRDITDIMVIDVVEFEQERLVVRFSLKQPLTYKEIDEYIHDIIEFVEEETNWRVTVEPVGVRWYIKDFGLVSERFDHALLLSKSKRQRMLQKIDIQFHKEEKSRSSLKFDLKPGFSYIVRERRPEKAMRVFVDLVKHDVQGLCITRLRPASIRELHGLRKTPILWLTQNMEEGEKCISPTDIPKLHVVISDFLEKTKGSVILLDGMEYIMTNNTFSTALKLVQLLNDRVMLSSSRILLPLDPEAFGDREYALLQRELKVMEV